ncbi:MAG: dTMP kinase [Armatimonadota bacterium]
MSLLDDFVNSRYGRFLVLEGVDGSGKSTQARLLAEWLQGQGRPTVLTYEPGGTALGEQLRAILLSSSVACAPRAELLMMLAARAQHVSEVIRPALQEGKVVISDRFSLSSLAYQGFGRGIPLDEIREADAVARGGLEPDRTLLLDLSLDDALARIGERQDRFEGEGRAFLQRIVEGYRLLAAGDQTIARIEGAEPVAVVQAQLRQIIETLLTD